jgi:hypothetical protein
MRRRDFWERAFFEKNVVFSKKGSRNRRRVIFYAAYASKENAYPSDSKWFAENTQFWAEFVMRNDTRGNHHLGITTGNQNPGAVCTGFPCVGEFLSLAGVGGLGVTVNDSSIIGIRSLIFCCVSIPSGKTKTRTPITLPDFRE